MTAIATIPKTEPAVARLTDTVAVKIREAAPQFAPFLPTGTDVEQVVAATFLEFQRIPKLRDCSAESVVAAVSKLVAGGADIGRTGYVTPFGKTATAVFGFKYFVEMVLASGAAHACDVAEVYEGDHFEYELGSNAHLKHIPGGKDAKHRGAVTHFYVCWRMKFGYVKFDVMTADEVDRIRKQYSKQWANGPLPIWYGKKTVIIHSAKYLPQNPKLARFFNAIADDPDAAFVAPTVTATATLASLDDAPAPVEAPVEEPVEAFDEPPVCVPNWKGPFAGRPLKELSADDLGALYSTLMGSKPDHSFIPAIAAEMESRRLAA